MALSIQSGANLTNTYFDYLNGVDCKENIYGERTLVDKKVSVFAVVSMSIIFYSIGIGVVYPLIISTSHIEFSILVITGLALGIFYTATPIALKYCALGDITIFISFGPLLMQATSFILVNSFSGVLHLYTIPIALLCEAILHANNSRDIKVDSRAGIVTLATFLGLSKSFLFYILLLAIAYIAIILIALFFHWGCLLCLFTIPVSLEIMESFRNGYMLNITQDTAKLHLIFGLLYFVGVKFTKIGIYQAAFLLFV